MSIHKVPAEKRFWPKVNVTETCWHWTGAKNEKGYGLFYADDKQIRAHRYSYQRVNGPIPDGLQIDHICHNPACVNPEHLRAVTVKQNNENRTTRTPTISGVRGVHMRIDGKWYGRVCHNKQTYRTGGFATIPEAEAAVVALRLELFTHNDLDRRAS